MQVCASKTTMVIYHFIKEDPIWPSMNQLMAATCAMGDIDEERDTVIYNSLMKSKMKK